MEAACGAAYTNGRVAPTRGEYEACGTSVRASFLGFAREFLLESSGQYSRTLFCWRVLLLESFFLLENLLLESFLLESFRVGEFRVGEFPGLVVFGGSGGALGASASLSPPVRASH